MFEGLDPLLLARVQFAFTVSFHIVFPSLSIGLGSYLAVLKGLWLITGEDRYFRLFRRWVKAFALLFFVCYCGIAVSVFPFVVPRAVTVWDAAAPDESLGFLLVGAVVLLPLILLYTGYSYWVFRGKTGSASHYGH